MGQGMLSRAWGKVDSNILITGLNDAGKSTLLKKLNLNDDTEFVAPFVIGPERSQHKNLVFTAWDLGGRNKSRALYRHFQPAMDSIIFVVDSHDRECFEMGEVRELLEAILSIKALPRVPLLVLANKQDLPGALSTLQVWSELGLDRVARERSVEILPTSLKTGDGLAEVLDWLVGQRTRKKFQNAVVKPLREAVPAPVTSASSKLSSALKGAFALAKEKLLS